MSTFKLRPEKVRHLTEIKTLDEIHRKIVAEFNKKKNDLPKKKTRLERLKTQLEKLENKPANSYTNDDIRLKSKLKSDITDLGDEIYDIENNISEAEYYSKTEEFLMDYYENDGVNIGDDDNLSENTVGIKKDEPKQMDTLDMLNFLNKEKRKHKKVAKKRKKRCPENTQNNILSFFECTIEKPEQIVPVKDKSALLDQFRMVIDSDYVCEKNKSYNPFKKCSNCSIDKILIQGEGMFVCLVCGEVENIIIESERPNYKEIVAEKPGYPYKRINHFNEWLSQFQAKETTEIPNEVYTQILAELHKNRVTDFKKISMSFMKDILKKLGLQQYYEHTTHIISKLSGQPPPVISRDIEEELRKMFRQIQAPFEKHCPKERINFLSYSYVLHKCCELLELDDFIKCFPLLKSREKLRQQDKIWEMICHELRWEFIPSRPTSV